LKDANKFYRKNLRKMDSRGLEYFGATVAFAGTGASLSAEHWWIPLLVAASGALIVGREVFRRKRTRRAIMKSLEKEVAQLGYDELEQRASDMNYEISRPDEEAIKNAEMENYSYKVINKVVDREYLLVNRLPSLGCIGLLLAGFYISQSGHAYTGGAIALIGAIAASVFEYRTFRKMSRLKKDVKRVIKNKGYEFMQLYANKHTPYDFYKRYILPEIKGKPTASQ
jgi:hypothetical protein